MIDSHSIDNEKKLATQISNTANRRSEDREAYISFCVLQQRNLILPVSQRIGILDYQKESKIWQK